MRVSIKGLRRWVLGAASLLLVVVAAFFLYGRYRFRHIEKDLPGRLGINIQQTATGWSYSQSSQGHTLFTLKASKESQLKSGHVLLHDVDITMYGPPGSGRQDRIYGSDFVYDQNSGIAVSQGDVNIELAGMNSPAPTEANGAGSNTIRVRTSGLTFAQKTGEADTAAPVEFQLPRAAGSSVGAHYNSKTGVLVLDSAVKITTSSNGRAAVIDADHATLLRSSLQGFLTNASIEYETEDGSADAATVYFRKDGTTEKIDAQGHVRMKTDTGSTMNAGTAHILMDAKSQPTQADLGGGVAFASAHGNASMHGTSSAGTMHFANVAAADGKAQTALTHAQFRQDVHFVDETAGLAKDPQGHTERQMQGQKVDIDFGPPTREGGVQAQKAYAEGNPVVTMRQIPSKGPAAMTRISGDHLVATLGPENVLQQLDGAGNTRVEDEAADGSHDTSQGDVLHTTFHQQPAAEKEGGATAHPAATASKRKNGPRTGKDAGPKMQTEIDTATQDGHVVLTESQAPRAASAKNGAPGSAEKPGSTTEPAMLTGWADHAEYHASDQVLRMTGSPRIRNEEADGSTMQVSANLIDYHRDTQDAAASGAVKATYTEQEKAGATKTGSAKTDTAKTGQAPSMGGNGPVHVIAQRAAMHHATNLNEFYGTVKEPARMWQDADSLTAPMIEIDRNKNLLKAQGEDTGTEPVVHANFTSAFGAKHQQSVARVRSQTLVYSDKDRQADFRGTVSMEQGDEVIHADDGLVFLKPAQTGAKKPGATAGGPPAATNQTSQIDHLIATGHVVFTQPGRKGEGEKLVYTADDGRYVLTGTPEALPHMWDTVHGTTTGTALLFNGQDDSVEVNGGKSSAVTDTRTPK